MNTVQWTPNPATEIACRTKYNINLMPLTIPVAQIDIKASYSNQARPEKDVSDDRVIEYAHIMESGDSAFERIIVYLAGKVYVVIDGNHRLAAFLLLGDIPPNIDVYVVDTDDPNLIEIMTRSWNTFNGMPPSYNWRMEQALYLFDANPGITNKDVARYMGMTSEAVGKIRRQYKVRQFCDAKKIYLPASTHYAVLAPYLGDEDLLFDAARKVVDYGLTTDDLKDMMRFAAKRKTSAAKLHAHTEWVNISAKEKTATTHRTSTKQFRDRFFKAVTNLIALLNSHPSLEELQLTARSDIQQAEFAIQELEKAIERALGNKHASGKTPKGTRTTAGKGLRQKQSRAKSR